MKILLLVNRSQRRGAEVFAHDLRNELRRRGHEAKLVALYGEIDVADRDFVDATLQGLSEHPSERLPGFNPALLRRLRRQERALDFDVVQVHGSRTVKYGSLLKRLDRRHRFRLVYRNIGDPKAWIGSPLRARLFRHLVLSQMEGIVAVSEATKRALIETYRPNAPIAQIPRGIDMRRLQPRRCRSEVRQTLGTPLDRAVVVFVGSLSREKRPDRFLRVLYRAASPELPIEAWLLGDGPLRADLEAGAREQVGHVTVRLFGVQRQIADFLAASDLLLLTSDTEGMPGALLEAAAVGLPAVATRVGGVEECVVHGTSGLLSNADDEEGLARSVAHLVADPAERTALGKAARQSVRGRFSIEAVCDRYLRFYDSLAAPDPDGTPASSSGSRADSSVAR